MDRYDLLLQLPDFYRSGPFDELQRVLGEMCRQAGEDLNFTLEQLWPQTASGWGLALWETAYGIPVEVEKDADFRRTRVISKLRGQGTPTAALIQTVAASFINGQVEVVEYSGQSRFVIRFTSMFGVPPNIDDLTAAIRDIKPAHLDFTYEFMFRIHAELGSYTHEVLAGYTHETLRGGDMS